MSKSKNLKEILLDRLQDNRFRNTIRQWISNIFSLADSFYNGTFEGSTEDLDYIEVEDIKSLVGDWRESYSNSLINYSANSEFFEQLVGKLSEPPIVSGEELFEELTTLIIPDKLEDQRFLRDFNKLYDCFIDNVRHRLVTDRRSDSFELWDFCNIPEGNENPESRIGVLRKTNCIGLYIDEIKSSEKFPHEGILTASFRGTMSERAFSKLMDNLIPAIPSIMKTISLIQYPPPRRKKLKLIIITNEFSLKRTMEKKKPSYEPPICFENLQEYSPFITYCLDSLSRSDGKKDTMDRRLGNAVKYLIAADNPNFGSVQLSLAVTAIEALLGEKGQDISHTLADRVMALLEPDQSLRPKAHDFMKKLYNERSKSLHGSRIEDSDSAKAARKLAACCLYGLWVGNGYKRRMEGSMYSPESLFDELDDSSKSAKRLDYFPEIPMARGLWHTRDCSTNPDAFDSA